MRSPPTPPLFVLKNLLNSIVKQRAGNTYECETCIIEAFITFVLMVRHIIYKNRDTTTEPLTAVYVCTGRSVSGSLRLFEAQVSNSVQVLRSELHYKLMDFGLTSASINIGCETAETASSLSLMRCFCITHSYPHTCMYMQATLIGGGGVFWYTPPSAQNFKKYSLKILGKITHFLFKTR